ncbi:hypothetical protein HAX54_034224 [Datura stramonium]|uniref:Uncharacterized protein n=1 Tax=Datura stramonium TaxID=4076 RepID=A0ABS8VGV2_DATST|nr:hypothetical protein [Datura stramonium]
MSDLPFSVAGTPSTPCTPSTPDVSIGYTMGSSVSSRLVIQLRGGKFVPNGHSISKKAITETFKERQDATGYSWKDVRQSTRKFYWHEFMKLYQWNPTENAIKRPNFVPDETGGPGTGPSKHTGGSRSTVEHAIKLAIELRRPANSWDIFKKLHKRKDGSFVDTKSKCINDKMEAIVAATILNSSDDSQELQEHEINRLYLMLWVERKNDVLTDHAAEERIKLLEEEVLHMTENQERILEERVEAEVQQRLEQEFSRLSQQSDDQFKSMEERWSRMMSDIVLSSHSSSGPTLLNRDTPNA